MKDWNRVKKDKELLRKVEDLVNEAGDYYDDLPEDICNELNELTGNNWEPIAYGERCSEWWESPWSLEQVVYSLFHDGELPDRNKTELY